MTTTLYPITISRTTRRGLSSPLPGGPIMTYAYLIENGGIAKLEVVKKTPKTIVVSQKLLYTLQDCHRKFKIADGKVFDTWREAHAALLAAAEQEVAAARLRLQQLNGHVGRIKGMKAPAEEGQS